MKKLEIIADELFNKIRGRYPKVTLGDSESTIVNDPSSARFFEFEVAPDRKVNITLDEEALTMLFNNNLFSEDESIQRKGWFGFMKELRQFARKRMLTFDTRDITKSNLDKRDFAYLSKEKSGDKQMSESKMYGTSQTSYQNVGNARLVVKHSEPIGETGNRNSKINAIYIESGQGEKFKYPFKHMNGARAAATHVSEGGNLYDDIGKHIVSLSEELSKLRKFKTYMNRSNVMAEGLGGYLDVVNTRIDTVKETVAKLQRPNYYKTFVENFAPNTTEDVPEDIQTDWIDQLTIKQFNEELKGVFPYIYKLVSEANAVKELGPEDLLGEAEDDNKQDNGTDKMDVTDADKKANTPAYKKMKAGDKRYNDKTTKESLELDDIDLAFEQMMGQFGDHVCEECGNPSWKVAVESEKQKGVDGKVCWKGYKRMGTKKKGGKTVDNCVKIKDDINEEVDKSALEAWWNKYSKYQGSNGDDLPGGMFRGYTDTGILTDGVEDNELSDAIEKLGGDRNEAEEKLFKDSKLFSELLPITDAMQKEYTKIMGVPAIDEDNVEDAIKILGSEITGFDVANEGEEDKEYDPRRVKADVVKHLVNIHNDAKKDDGYTSEPMHFQLGNLLHDMDMAGYMNSDYPDIEKLFHMGIDKKKDYKVDMDMLKKAYANAKNLDGDSNEGNAYSGAVEEGINAELLGDLQSGLEDAKAGNDMADFIADEIGDYIRSGIEEMGEEEWQNSVEGQALAELDPTDSPEAQAQGFQKAINILKQNEGNAYAQKVRQAKMNGKKKGDKIDGPDGDKITLEKDKKTPLGEFILSYFDRETGQFPKGETAVLTMVEKDYGDEYVVPASKFIESIFKTYEAFGTSEAPIEQEEASDLQRIRDLAGL